MNVDWYVNVCVLLVHTCLCLVGKMVGTLVGTSVGTLVGTIVGTLVGTLVGISRVQLSLVLTRLSQTLRSGF